MNTLRLRSVLVGLAVGVVLLVGCPVMGVAQAQASTTRMVINGKWSKNMASFYWTTVPKARYYKVKIAPGDFVGPICGCSGDRVDIPMWNIPYSMISAKIKNHGLRVAISAYDSQRHLIGGSEGIIRSRKVGHLVPITTKRRAQSKIHECLRDGLTAAATTTVGLGTVNVVADWVPGVDVVTAGGSAVSIGVAGYASYIVCIAMPR